MMGSRHDIQGTAAALAQIRPQDEMFAALVRRRRLRNKTCRAWAMISEFQLAATDRADNATLGDQHARPRHTRRRAFWGGDGHEHGRLSRFGTAQGGRQHDVGGTASHMIFVRKSSIESNTRSGVAGASRAGRWR